MTDRNRANKEEKLLEGNKQVDTNLGEYNNKIVERNNRTSINILREIRKDIVFMKKNRIQ